MKPILQVEDDPNDIFLLQHAFRKVGARNPIHIATDGQQAIDYLDGAGKFADRTRFPFPCLALLDLNLPCMPGLKLLSWIRQECRIPLVVLVLSSSADEKEIADAYQLGANGYLVKPAQASKLLAMAKAIKDFWLNQNMLPKESRWEMARFDAHRRTKPFVFKPLVHAH